MTLFEVITDVNIDADINLILFRCTVLTWILLLRTFYDLWFRIDLILVEVVEVQFI
jgi:hypothetical protein